MNLENNVAKANQDEIFIRQLKLTVSDDFVNCE